MFKEKYCKMHCVYCMWNSDHTRHHRTLLSNSQPSSSSFDQGELKCVCMNCFTPCLLPRLGEHKMPRPLVGVCHKCFWWNSHLRWVRFYTGRTSLYVYLRHSPRREGIPKKIELRFLSCSFLFYSTVLRFFPVLNILIRHLVYFWNVSWNILEYFIFSNVFVNSLE